jgi:hypothetical protein
MVQATVSSSTHANLLLLLCRYTLHDWHQYLVLPLQYLLLLFLQVESKRIAKQAGLNIIPGFIGEIKDEAHALQVSMIEQGLH